jgi:branched-chain amino acid transport system substrate-binding protein
MASDDKSKAGDGFEVKGLRPITRRDFLKTAGIGAAALGIGGGLSGALAACGTTSSGDSGGSTASAGGTGREVKVGFVSPLTGPLAAFGEADQFCVDQWNAAVKDGVKCGDGQTHPITIIMKDSQSDTNRAAQVAGDLITNDGVDVMMVTSTPDTVNPVADQAEALGTPCVSNDCPLEAYYAGRGVAPFTAGAFKWTYHAFWGIQDLANVQLNMWDSITTNKKVGVMWPNDADGLSDADPKTGLRIYYNPDGYSVVDGGRFQNGSEDFTTQISKFKAANCEISSGVMIPPDFTNFWKQCLQQGFNPAAMTMAKALLFPSAVEALGDIGYGLSSEVWWSPSHPFKSSLTGETCQQIADAYETSTGKQWTQPIMHYEVFEVVVDALKRATSVDDKQVLVDAIKNTNLDTLAGHISWTAGPPLNPGDNVCVTALTGGQWNKGTTYPFNIDVVNSDWAKKQLGVDIPTTATFAPIKY